MWRDRKMPLKREELPKLRGGGGGSRKKGGCEIFER